MKHVSVCHFRWFWYKINFRWSHFRGSTQKILEHFKEAPEEIFPDFVVPAVSLISESLMSDCCILVQPSSNVQLDSWTCSHWSQREFYSSEHFWELCLSWKLMLSCPWSQTDVPKRKRRKIPIPHVCVLTAVVHTNSHGAFREAFGCCFLLFLERNGIVKILSDNAFPVLGVCIGISVVKVLILSKKTYLLWFCI